jgi:hypothetical protein
MLKTVCPVKEEFETIEFPNKDYRAELAKQNVKNFWLSGFSNSEDGKGFEFNFIWSNGSRTN